MRQKDMKESGNAGSVFSPWRKGKQRERLVGWTGRALTVQADLRKRIGRGMERAGERSREEDEAG